MKPFVFIGIDISKLTLDVCILSGQQEKSMLLENSSDRIGTFFNQIINTYGQNNLLVAMENTGIYNWNLQEILQQIKIPSYLFNPLHLKRSIGLARGKTDVIDAHRIAIYLQKHHKDLEPSLFPEKRIRQLKVLTAHRKRLVHTKTGLSTPVNELKRINDHEIYESVSDSNQNVIAQINQEIKHIEQQIDQIIQQCQSLHRSYKLIQSVPGVGPVLARELLIKTNNFQSITNPRKLACYAGVVPFEYQSGSSIYRKPRVSFYADKSLKKLLHMAALRVTQIKGELQDYFFRKVAEGKNKMTVINALRNKIIHRVFAVIKNQKSYQDYLVLS